MANMRIRNSDRLYEQMKEGRVYRREELVALSRSVDRELKQLVKADRITQAASGLYYRPKMSRFGALPAETHEVVRAFLKTDDFLITALDNFNGLGVGLTQLVNEHLVYNRRRVGRFQLDRRNYYFKRPTNFPRAKEVTEEYLFVDLLNNYDYLLEPPDRLWESLQRRVKELSMEDLKRLADRYGKASTRRMLNELSAHG